MLHNVKVKDSTINVEFGCNHPKIKNNQCPLGKSDCLACTSCRDSLSATDFFKLMKEVKS